MLKSTKLNKLCICFRGLKLGPNPPLSEASRSLPIDFNQLFIQPLLGLKSFVIKLSSFPENDGRFQWSWHSVHVHCTLRHDLLKRMQVSRATSLGAGTAVLPPRWLWCKVVGHRQPLHLHCLLQLLRLFWFRTYFISKLEFLLVLLIFLLSLNPSCSGIK